MPRSPLFWKVYSWIAAVAVISAATVYGVAAPRLRRSALDDIRRELTARAVLLDVPARVFRTPPSPELQERVRRLGARTGTRFTVIRGDGLVYADSREDPARMENHRERPEVRSARRTRRPGTSTRLSRTVGERMSYLALPILEGKGIAGYVRTALPYERVTERLSSLALHLGLGAAVAVLLGFGVGLFLARHFTGPLRRMTRVAAAIAEGDYDHRLHFRRKDEVGQLAVAIQHMSDQLRERMAALTRERNNLQAILGSMLEGVIAVDAAERIVHINAVAARLLDTTVSEGLGRRAWEVARIEAIGETIRRILEEPGEYARELTLPRSRGERVLTLHASPLRGEAGAPSGAVVVMYDVTDLRRLEAVRRDFVANVSHEIKTPLTAIRGFVETLLDHEEADTGTRTRFLERIRDQALRLSSLVSDLLALSRVETEDAELEHVRFDLAPLLREVAGGFEPEVLGRSLAFRVEIPETPYPVVGDREALRQAVGNLLDNAFKYTPDEGTVTLRLRRAGDAAVLEVEDTGIGIGPEHLDRIFERFYRVDKARSRALGGTGLGLSIVKHIVKAHAGKVSVTSTPGEGSTFTVTLPLLPDDSSTL